MLAREGASEVIVTSREKARADHVAQELRERFGVEIIPKQAFNSDDRGTAIEGANIVIATGAAGVELIKAEHWQNNASINMMADANATPPIGIGGTDMMDRGIEREGKIIWGAIGFGTLKLALHRACIAKLFETNNLSLDAEEIFAIAKSMN